MTSRHTANRYVAIVGARAGVNMVPRPRKPTRVHRAQGEYQPPEPSEGRYWQVAL